MGCPKKQIYTQRVTAVRNARTVAVHCNSAVEANRLLQLRELKLLSSPVAWRLADHFCASNRVVGSWRMDRDALAAAIDGGLVPGPRVRDEDLQEALISFFGVILHFRKKAHQFRHLTKSNV